MDIKRPKGVYGLTIQCDEHGNIKQWIAHNEAKTKYYLYNVLEDGSLVKIETADTPCFKKDMFNKTK
jgi:hypothetical protein